MDYQAETRKYLQMDFEPLTPEPLRMRTKQCALRIIRLSQELPNSTQGCVIGKQVLRCGTSVAANYRAACRARSKPDFTSKIGIVLEEADETVFWLELLVESGLVGKEKIDGLLRESRELMAIFAAAHQTARSSRKRRYV
jgi:four helix bundle protein